MTGTLYYINVTIHLLMALLWLGGLFFFALVGAPVLRRIDDEALRARLFQALGEKFRTIGWVAIGVLLVTGVVNLGYRGVLSVETLTSNAFWTSRYGRALVWKLGAVAIMIVVSALHDFLLGPAASRLPAGSAEAVRMRRRASWIARINAVAGIVAVVAAVRLARGG